RSVAEEGEVRRIMLLGIVGEEFRVVITRPGIDRQVVSSGGKARHQRDGRDTDADRCEGAQRRTAAQAFALHEIGKDILWHHAPPVFYLNKTSYLIIFL